MPLRTQTATVLFVILVSVLGLLPLHFIHQASAAQSHSPITINGNAGFTAANGVISGSGTASDPYVIGGWEIFPAPFFNTAISVSDTSAYFVVRNIIAHEFGSQFQNVTHFVIDGFDSPGGLSFGNVRNGVIERITGPLSVTGSYCRGYCPYPGGTNITIANSVINRLHVDHSQNVTISGNTISGSTVKGIDMDLSSNVTITNNTVSSNMEDGIAFFGYHVAVSYNNITANVGNGLSFSGEDISVFHNHFSGNGLGIPRASRTPAAGLALSGVNLTIQDNTFDSDGILGAPVAVAPNYFIASGNLANGNPILFYHDCQGVNVDNIPVGQILIANCNHVRIANVRILNTAEGVQLNRVNNTIISGSEFSMNKNDGISIQSSKNVTMSNDKIVGNRGNGISVGPGGAYVVRSGLITLRDSEVGNNGDGIHFDSGAGIWLNADNCTLTRNTVYTNQLSGILSGGTNNTISYNTVTSNGARSAPLSTVFEWMGGISTSLGSPATSVSDFFWITGNNISNNYPYGLGIIETRHANATDNLTSSNQGYGILVSGSDYGTIYHNNMINDIVEGVEAAFGMQYSSSWSIPYPGGGNYWSDYAGNDLCSGPNQDQCNAPDRIGDTPKTLFACVTEVNYICGNFNNTDRYPLMRPYGFVPDSDPPNWSNASLRVIQATTSTITLQWTPAIDQIGATRYSIYEGSSRIATVRGAFLTYTVTGLTAGTPYSFHVEAIDPWGNWSTNGPSVNVSTTGWWQYWYLVVVVVAGVGTAAFLHWKGWLRLWRRPRITLSKRPAQISKGCWLSSFLRAWFLFPRLGIVIARNKP